VRCSTDQRSGPLALDVSDGAERSKLRGVGRPSARLSRGDAGWSGANRTDEPSGWALDGADSAGVRIKLRPELILRKFDQVSVFWPRRARSHRQGPSKAFTTSSGIGLAVLVDVCWIMRPAAGGVRCLYFLRQCRIPGASADLRPLADRLQTNWIGCWVSKSGGRRAHIGHGAGQGCLGARGKLAAPGGGGLDGGQCPGSPGRSEQCWPASTCSIGWAAHSITRVGLPRLIVPSYAAFPGGGCRGMDSAPGWRFEGNCAPEWRPSGMRGPETGQRTWSWLLSAGLGVARYWNGDGALAKPRILCGVVTQGGVYGNKASKHLNVQHCVMESTISICHLSSLAIAEISDRGDLPGTSRWLSAEPWASVKGGSDQSLALLRCPALGALFACFERRWPLPTGQSHATTQPV